MKTLVNDPFEDDAAEILEWGYGEEAKRQFLHQITTHDIRVGQAFMNTLRDFDLVGYRRLTGSLVDPFYDDAKLPAAIDRLTSK